MTAVITPKSDTEALIDLRARYARCTRMVWTALGITVGLVASVLMLSVVLYQMSARLEAQEQVRRRDRAEQRFALCLRDTTPRALCAGYESLSAAYATEGTEPPHRAK